MTTMMWLLVAVFAAVLVGGGLLARRREVRIREAHSAALECRDQELSQVREESTQRAESSNHQLTLVEQTAKAREQRFPDTWRRPWTMTCDPATAF